MWASQVRGYGFNSAGAEQAAAAVVPPAPPPPLPPRDSGQPATAAAAAAATAAAEEEEDNDSEWWRAGEGGPAAAAAAAAAAAVGGGAGGHRHHQQQQSLFALEVVKPLMRQDLERLSDQVCDFFSFFSSWCVRSRVCENEILMFATSMLSCVDSLLAAVNVLPRVSCQCTK